MPDTVLVVDVVIVGGDDEVASGGQRGADGEGEVDAVGETPSGKVDCGFRFVVELNEFAIAGLTGWIDH